MSLSFRDHSDANDPQRSDSALPPDVAADGPIPDELVDRMFDNEVHPAAAADLMKLIRADRQASDRLDATTRIFKALKQADRAEPRPDFSAAILAQVSARSGLFSRFGLRRMQTYRYAAAATLLLAAASVFFAQRVAPETVRLAAQPAPLTRVVAAMPTESADVFSGFRSVFTSIREAVPSPAPSSVEVRRIVRLSDERRDLFASGVNPPLAAVLWVDDRADASVGCARTLRCRTSCGTSIFPTVTMDAQGRSPRESNVVTVSFNR